MQHDMTQPIRIDEPVDFVYHLASPASPIDYLRLPLQTLKVGSYGTHNALGLAKSKRARFLLASTSEVYGDPQVHPQPETYWGNVNPIGPRGVYDEAKRYAEALTMAYHRQQGVDTAIVRIFNTYGPRMRPHDGRAIPTFVRQALEREAAHGLRRRLADPQLLLRRRPDPRPHRARRERRAPAGQHRQPAGVHAARARREGARGLGRRQRDRLRGAAGRRSRRCASRTSRARASCSAGSRRSALDEGLRTPARVALRERAGCLGASLALRPRSSRPRSSPCPRRPRRATSSTGSSTTRRSTTATRTRSSRMLKHAEDAGDPRQPRLGRRRTASPSAGRPTRRTRTTRPTTGRSTTAPSSTRSSTGSRSSSRSSARRRGRTAAKGGNVAPTNAARPPALRDRRRAALQRHLQGAGRARSCRPSAAGSPGTSRTTRSSCGRSTRRSSGTAVIQSAIDYAKICNAVFKRRPHDDARRLEGRLRRHRPARQQQPELGSARRVAARRSCAR